MKSVELSSDEVAEALVIDGKLEAFAFRKEFPESWIPRDKQEVDRWNAFLQLDYEGDAIVTRYLSIDLRSRKGVLFYERNKAWCFEHRCYMTAEDRWQLATQGPQVGPHYKFHGLTEDQYLHQIFDGANKETIHGFSIHNS